MGLYLAMVLLWIVGATNERYERAAITSEIFFMSGLAFGADAQCANRWLAALAAGKLYRRRSGSRHRRNRFAAASEEDPAMSIPKIIRWSPVSTRIRCGGSPDHTTEADM